MARKPCQRDVCVMRDLSSDHWSKAVTYFVPRSPVHRVSAAEGVIHAGGKLSLPSLLTPPLHRPPASVCFPLHCSSVMATMTPPHPLPPLFCPASLSPNCHLFFYEQSDPPGEARAACGLAADSGLVVSA